MRRWAVSVCCRKQHCSSPHSARGRASTQLSNRLVGTLWPVQLPPMILHHPPLSPVSTSRHNPSCCGNRPGWWSWYTSVSWGWSRRYVPPICTARAQTPVRHICWRSWCTIPGGAAAGGVVAATLSEGGTIHGRSVGWNKLSSQSFLKICTVLPYIVYMAVWIHFRQEVLSVARNSRCCSRLPFLILLANWWGGETLFTVVGADERCAP